MQGQRGARSPGSKARQVRVQPASVLSPLAREALRSEEAKGPHVLASGWLQDAGLGEPKAFRGWEGPTCLWACPSDLGDRRCLWAGCEESRVTSGHADRGSLCELRAGGVLALEL